MGNTPDPYRRTTEEGLNVPKKHPSLLEVAQQIAAEFTEAEALRGTHFRSDFAYPANPKRRIQNSVGVRVTLLRKLREALKAEAANA